MYQELWIVSLLYPLGLFFAIYFSAIFLGLTIWREKVQRPRALGWSAILLFITLFVLLLIVPSLFLIRLLDLSYSYSSSEFIEVITLAAGLIFFPSLIGSLVLFVAAIVPAGLRKRPPPKPTRDPEKNPWDD
jgi:hypothetical protein